MVNNPRDEASVLTEKVQRTMCYRLATLVIVFAMAFVVGCTCFSTKVVNNTDEAVFVNIAYYDDGRLFEEEGLLLNPSTSSEIPTYSRQIIRVRDMSGQTVAFQEAKDDGDSKLDIMNLDFVQGAPPVGKLSTEGNGPHSFLCGDERNGVQLFGTTVTVTSEYAEPLVVSIVRDWDKPSEAREKRGVLLPAGGVAEVYGLIVERGWLRAVNQRGELVYARVVPRRETSSASIPSQFLEVAEIEAPRYC